MESRKYRWLACCTLADDLTHLSVDSLACLLKQYHADDFEAYRSNWKQSHPGLNMKVVEEIMLASAKMVTEESYSPMVSDQVASSMQSKEVSHKAILTIETAEVVEVPVQQILEQVDKIEDEEEIKSMCADELDHLSARDEDIKEDSIENTSELELPMEHNDQ